MGIITEYLKYQEEYQEKYGERTVVLYQNGSFYELFQYNPQLNETDEVHAWPDKNLGHAVHLSKILGYTLTRRSKAKPYSLSNPNMIGFPCIAYEKHKTTLLSEEYTIVIVDQDKPGKNATRRVTKVLSPATEINDLNPIPVSNQIACIYIEVQKEAPKFDDYLITVGVSTIDVTTGNNMVSEIYSKEKDAIHALQEIYRFLISSQPRELIVVINNCKKNKEKYKKYITNTLELNTYSIWSISTEIDDNEYLSTNYHQKFLSKIFYPGTTSTTSNKTITNKTIIIENKIILEELGLERFYYGTVSYVLLLQYCYEHNDKLLEKINNPDTSWIDENTHLIVTHNAHKQLDTFSPAKSKKSEINSLFSIVNHTSTSLGKRFLHQILSNPITDPTTITKYYNMCQDLVDQPDLTQQVENILKNIPDIERYQRKLQLKIINPNEFSILFKAYINIVKLYTIIMKSSTCLTDLLFKKVNDFNSCLTTVLSRYNIEHLTNATIETHTNYNILLTPNPIFYTNIDQEADKYHQLIQTYTQQITSIINHLNTHLTKTRGKLIEYIESKKGETLVGFSTTLAKGKKIALAISNKQIDIELCGNIQITNGKETFITSNIIATLCQNIARTKCEYGQYLYRCYNRTVDDISTKYNFFNDINVFISKLDYVKSNAKSATKNNYFKPEISSDITDVSFFEAKNLRHPIVEKLIDGKYVPNDLSLGSKPYGMLLYGSNSVGKSTLTKSIGLIIMMAQSGMFVPCQLKYAPYNKMITRLSGNDDLIRGKSSFVVEMTELRTILRNADSKTLVLGDELCRGTETDSGTGLTIATIEELVKRKSTFIFSTHMHHLTTNPNIVNIEKNSLKISHMVLRYDEDTNNLIFDRTLKDGQGDSIYGLEVAMSLSMNMNFIERAGQIRRDFISLEPKNKQLLNTKKSKYNKKIYMDSCTICGKKAKWNENLHSHHSEEQRKANKNGYIDHYHKNLPDLIIVLCESCHTNLHSNGLKIITQQTPSGKIIKIPLK